MTMRGRIGGFVRAALAAAAVAGVSFPAAAQVGPFRHAGLNLTSEDLAAIDAASAKLYAAAEPRIGASETWANAKSGNAGTVTLVTIYTWSGMPCRGLVHRITTPSRQDPQTIQIDRCRTAAGEWKIRA
jgi:surface antigen